MRFAKACSCAIVGQSVAFELDVNTYYYFFMDIRVCQNVCKFAILAHILAHSLHHN